MNEDGAVVSQPSGYLLSFSTMVCRNDPYGGGLASDVGGGACSRNGGSRKDG